MIDGYTEEFEKTFMEHLRRCHPFSRVAAKVVYNEYIADRYVHTLKHLLCLQKTPGMQS